MIPGLKYKADPIPTRDQAGFLDRLRQNIPYLPDNGLRRKKRELGRHAPDDSVPPE